MHGWPPEFIYDGGTKVQMLVNSAQFILIEHTFSDPLEDNRVKFEIRVIPNSKEFNIKKKGDIFVIHIKSKAKQGKANVELIKRLKKIVKKDVNIITGASGRKKVIEIEGEEQEILQTIKREISS